MARAPTPDQLKVNLEMCQHEVERLRAAKQTLKAMIKELRAEIRGLRERLADAETLIDSLRAMQTKKL